LRFVRPGLLLVAVVAALALPAGARAAKHCGEPGVRWQRATPAQVGMDAAKVEDAVQYASSRGTSSAVRVYRYGCLVAEDSVNPESVSAPWQSFSLAKSIVSLTFGRAWTLGLISPDDPVGSLFPEADAAHGALLMRHLLTMTSGASLITTHDLDLGMPDRVRDALTIPLVAKPGTTFAYWQTGPPTVAAAIGRAAGEDFQAFAQRELFGPIGIEPGSWLWTRDAAGNTDGFWGLYMSADDFARFGDLLRRGGLWRGRRLLSRRFVHAAVRPIQPFGCYAWFIWRQATKRCNWPVFLGLPEDMWQFNGANGQLVTAFPSLGLMVARTGVDASQGTDWAPGTGNAGGEVEREFYDRLLRAVTDRHVEVAHPPADPHRPTATQQARFDDPSGNPVAGGLSSLAQPALPPAGPWRARAVQIDDAPVRVSHSGRFSVLLHCPPRLGSAGRRCAGRLKAGRARATFDLPAGADGAVRMRLKAPHRRSVTITAISRDGTRAGTRTSQTVRVARP
jgi:CubicO group peptidase (beta-lactamase class C family)